MSRQKLAVVSGGLRQPSSTRLLADRLAEATVKALDESGAETEVAVVELRDHAHDLMNNLLTGFPAPKLASAIAEVVRADGLIAVSPVFTASVSGLFKSFVDVLDAGALTGMPVLVGATGGTERHSLVLDYAMRPMFTYLQAVVVPTGVYAATSDWGERDRSTAVDPAREPAAGGAAELGYRLGDDVSASLGERIDRAAGELAALVVAGRRRELADPFQPPTPFDQLLPEN